MNDLQPSPPDWSPEEIRFLSDIGAIDHPGQIEDVELIKRRWVYRTLREVFRTPNGFILKRYANAPGRNDMRRVWQREDGALRELAGLPVPNTSGFVQFRNHWGKQSILYARSLVPGSPITDINQPLLEKIGHLLASFHRRGIITQDASPDNFLLEENTDQTLWFIDFGRARHYRSANALYWTSIGKEFALLQYHFGLSSAQMASLLAAYWQQSSHSQLAQAFILWRFHRLQRRYVRRAHTRLLSMTDVTKP